MRTIVAVTAVQFLSPLVADNANAQTLTTLFSFSGTESAEPTGSLTLNGFAIYGTTWGGGAYNDGVVFSILTSGGNPTTSVSFNGTTGFGPNGNLTLSGSTLYGVTENGGLYNERTVFSVPIVSLPT